MAVYSIASVKTRYFEFENPAGGGVLHIEPPKVKTVAKMQKIDDTDMEAFVDIVSKIISKNKEGYKMTAEAVQEAMDMDQMMGFFSAFMDWLNNVKAADPN